MKLLIATFTTALLATSAMAQSGDSSSTDTRSGTSTQTTTGSTQSGSGAAMPQETVRKQLTDAGFKEVEILDASYLVRAQTEDGNSLLMVIDPPLADGSASGPSSDSSGSGN